MMPRQLAVPANMWTTPGICLGNEYLKVSLREMNL